MDEKQKGLIILGVAAFLIIIFIIFGIVGSYKGKEYVKKLNTAISGSEKTLVYLGRPTCSYCNLLDPSIKDMASRYHFNYLYINSDEMAPNQIKKVLKLLNLSSLSTPHLAIVQNGEIVAEHPGFGDYDEIFYFLRKNGIIDEAADLSLNYISYSQYEALLNSKTAQIIVIGQSLCSHCAQAKPALNNIADKYNLTINYLNVTSLTTEEKTDFTMSLDYFSSSFGTPVMLIVKDNQLVSASEGFVNEERYVEFLKEQGFINE